MSSLPQHAGARPPVTLILGGARSGKSRHAQHLAERYSRVLFLATATAVDEEMRLKIARHRTDRPAHWQTAEEPIDLPGVIAAQGPTVDFLLIDCLTLYVANLLHRYKDDSSAIPIAVDRLLQTLAAPPCPIALVSNEVGSGIVPAYELGRQYRDLLGELNQRVAQVATDVLLMVAGLPLVLKAVAS